MNIRSLCYELYKIDWKYRHITPQIEKDSIKVYYEGLVDDDTDYTYDEFIEEFGYNSELYVCFDEFCENEYFDIDYMRTLLDNDKLIKLYYKDIEEEVKPKKCYRFFIDDCGQGFTAPCCHKVNENGDFIGDYYTFVKCKGNVNDCPLVKRILNQEDIK